MKRTYPHDRTDAIGADGWSDWNLPVQRGYRLGCCDCGLIHEMDFRVEGGNVEYRIRRDNRATAQIRRHRFRPAPAQPPAEKRLPTQHHAS